LGILFTILWFYLLKQDAVKANIWLFLTPIAGYFLASTLLGEEITIYDAIAFLFVFKARELFESVTLEPRKCTKCGQDLNESSIGKYVSQGCVRMHKADIEKLYDKVQVGTPVAITYSYKSFVDLTKIYGYQFKGNKLKNY
jgi:hypothetical protein